MQQAADDQATLDDFEKCHVRLQVRRQREDRRRKILAAWARAHGLAAAASSSLLELLVWFDARIEEEAKRASAAKDKKDAASAATSAATGTAGAPASSTMTAQAPSPAGGSSDAPIAEFDALRKTILEDSLGPHATTDAATLRDLVADGGSRLRPALLRRLLLARAELPREAGGAGSAGGASVAEEEAALLDALRPWSAAHTPADLLVVLPSLRLASVPLSVIGSHVYGEGGLLRDAAHAGSALRRALGDALLPGVRQLQCLADEGDAPHELTCCITMELMKDPVVAHDGKSYERTAIADYWKREGRPVSPITRLELKSDALIPNVALRAICAEYAAKQQRHRLAVASPEDVVMAALHSASLPPAAPPSASKRDRDDGTAGAEGGTRLQLLKGENRSSQNAKPPPGKRSRRRVA